jgi:hypothetical protein
MRLWLSILITPLIALLQLAANYALVPLACEKQLHAPIHLVAGAALLAALAGVWMAWSAWRDAGVHSPGDWGDALSRRRFLAAIGISLSGLMVLTIVAQWLTAAFVPPCVR